MLIILHFEMWTTVFYLNEYFIMSLLCSGVDTQTCLSHIRCVLHNWGIEGCFWTLHFNQKNYPYTTLESQRFPYPSFCGAWAPQKYKSIYTFLLYTDIFICLIFFFFILNGKCWKIHLCISFFTLRGENKYHMHISYQFILLNF